MVAPVIVVVATTACFGGAIAAGFCAAGSASFCGTFGRGWVSSGVIPPSVAPCACGWEGFFRLWFSALVSLLDLQVWNITSFFLLFLLGFLVGILCEEQNNSSVECLYSVLVF